MIKKSIDLNNFVYLFYDSLMETIKYFVYLKSPFKFINRIKRENDRKVNPINNVSAMYEYDTVPEIHIYCPHFNTCTRDNWRIKLSSAGNAIESHGNANTSSNQTQTKMTVPQYLSTKHQALNTQNGFTFEQPH